MTRSILSSWYTIHPKVIDRNIGRFVNGIIYLSLNIIILGLNLHKIFLCI